MRRRVADQKPPGSSMAVSSLGLPGNVHNERFGSMLGSSGSDLVSEHTLAETDQDREGPLEVEIPKDKDERPAVGSALASFGSLRDGAGPTSIATVIRPGEEPSNYVTSELQPTWDRRRSQAVAPGGAPTLGNASNDCVPSTAGAALTWNVVSADALNWRANVRSLTLKGQVNVKPWPSNPTSTATPNTPNPVDGGNITQANFQGVINDLADYNMPGGGAGPDWHSTAASHAHEWAHWNTDYVTDSVSSAAGGNWPTANQDIDAMTAPKAASATAGDARTSLEPRVNARVATWRAATIARWNAIPDTPGVAGSTGYVAGTAVLAGLIGGVQNYATSKGWLGPPPAPGPGPAPAPPGPAPVPGPGPNPGP